MYFTLRLLLTFTWSLLVQSKVFFPYNCFLQNILYVYVSDKGDTQYPSFVKAIQKTKYVPQKCLLMQ